MAKKLAMIIDEDLCWGCDTCELACKQENNPPEGSRWIRGENKRSPKNKWEVKTYLFTGPLLPMYQASLQGSLSSECDFPKVRWNCPHRSRDLHRM